MPGAVVRSARLVNPGSDQKVSGDLPGGADFQGLEQEEGRAWNAVECRPQVQVTPEEGGRRKERQHPVIDHPQHTTCFQGHCPCSPSEQQHRQVEVGVAEAEGLH